MLNLWMLVALTLAALCVAARYGVYLQALATVSFLGALACFGVGMTFLTDHLSENDALGTALLVAGGLLSLAGALIVRSFGLGARRPV